MSQYCLKLYIILNIKVEYVQQPKIRVHMYISEIDNDAYCVCTHDFSPCTHRNISPVRTMYAVKISGTQTVYDLMRTQIKIPAVNN